jgi:transcriptional regulator with XRE-family HTH domain
MKLQVVVGRNVRSLRDARGLAQDALAHEAGIHVTYLSGLENGHRNCTLAVLERLARALSVSEIDLVTRAKAGETAGRAPLP